LGLVLRGSCSTGKGPDSGVLGPGPGSLFGATGVLREPSGTMVEVDLVQTSPLGTQAEGFKVYGDKVEDGWDDLVSHIECIDESGWGLRRPLIHLLCLSLL
jgi:hypothetical protein